MERDALLEQVQNIEYIRKVRRINIAYYITFLFTAILSYVILFVTLILAHNNPNYRTVLIIIGIILAGAIILITDFLRSDKNYLLAFSNILKRISNHISTYFKSDFLAPHYIASLIFIWIPFIVVFIVMTLGIDTWISPGSTIFSESKEIINQFIVFSATLLGAQLTLFIFLTGHFVGKYSSNLASAIVRHRAIISVILFPFICIISFGFGLLWGYPNSFTSWPILIGILMLVCLVLSVLITICGADVERAIVYAGRHFAQFTRRTVKKPYTSLRNKKNTIWNLLANIGLDFRDTERLIGLVPPPKGPYVVQNYLMGLFNAANKAIQDGQQEVFRASLRAICDIAQTYTDYRKYYLAAEDDVFSFLNDQMAALFKSTSKASNEYLITDAIRHAGCIARLSLKIGNFSNLRDEIEEEQPRLMESPLVIFWFGLLKEGFDVSHTLMRSTAASESLNQMKLTAIAALDEGYYENVTYNYLPTIKQIHQSCLLQQDAYHIHLAATCLQDLLTVWWYPIVKKCKVSHYQIHSAMIQAIREIATLQMRLQTRLAADFSNVANVFTSKISSDKLILQDIFFAIAYYNKRENQEAVICTEELIDIIELVAELGCNAIENNQLLSSNYGEALYEIGYFVLKGIPQLPPEFQQRLEKEIFTAWEKLVSIYYKDYGTLAHEWEHSMFGLLGYGMAIYEQRPNDRLKEKLTDCIKFYLKLIQEEQQISNSQIRDDALDFLQLAGAWTSFFLKDQVLAQSIIDIIKKARSGSSSSFRGTARSRFASLGYPKITFHDFFLPNLMNIRVYVTLTDWKSFKIIQNRVMDKEVLLPYAAKINKTDST